MHIAIVTVILSYFCENLADNLRTDTDDMKFLRRKIRHAFTDQVSDRNILINLVTLNVKKKTADRKMNVL